MNILMIDSISIEERNNNCLSNCSIEFYIRSFTDVSTDDSFARSYRVLFLLRSSLVNRGLFRDLNPVLYR